MRRILQRPATAAAARQPRVLTKGSEVNASNDTRNVYSETSVAVSPSDTRSILAGSNIIAFDGGPVIAYLSRDRGATYTRASVPATISGTTYPFDFDPAVAWDRSGNGYFSFMAATDDADTSRPVVAILRAGSNTWSGPYRVSATAAYDDKDYLTVDNAPGSPYAGRVYMTWDRSAPTLSDPQHAVIARSDDGVNWQPPVQVDDANSTGYAIYVTPATGPNGEVYVVWNEYSEANGGFLLLNVSHDGGATFGADTVVTDLRLNLQPNPADAYSVYTIPAQPSRGIAAAPSIGVDNSDGPRRGWVYVCYCDVTAGKSHDDTDVFVRHSTDGGRTWSDPVRVNDDTTANSQFFPWMSVDPVDGSVNVSWYDCRDDAVNKKANVYYSRSSDGGVTFEPNTRITSASSDESRSAADVNQYGDYEGISAIGGQVVPVWTDARSSIEQVYLDTLIQSAAAPTGLRQTEAGGDAPPGTTSPSIRPFTFYATLDGPSATLIPEWEIKSVATAFNGSGTYKGSAVSYNGIPVTVAYTPSPLVSGGYHWRVRALRGDGLGVAGDWVSFGGNAENQPDFVVGNTYTIYDGIYALQMAGGLVKTSANERTRLDVSNAATGAKGADGRVTIADAARLIRAAAGLGGVP